MSEPTYSPESIKHALEIADQKTIDAMIKGLRNSHQIEKFMRYSPSQKKKELERILIIYTNVSRSLKLDLLSILGVQSLEETQRLTQTEAIDLAKEANSIARSAKSESTFSKWTAIISILIAAGSLITAIIKN